MISLDTSNKGLIGIFFLYLVILSGEGSGALLNCKLRKIVNGNMYIQHLLVFLSIFLFTFILNWYTPSSLVLNPSVNTEASKVIDNKSKKYTYIFNSVKYSIFIYIFFLLSTKLTPLTQGIFFVLLIVLFIIFIFYKIELEDKGIDHSIVDKYFVTNEYLSQITGNDNVNELFLLHNGLSLGYLTILINSVFGVYEYYKKQRKDHGKDWSLLKFVFGVDKCSSM